MTIEQFRNSELSGELAAILNMPAMAMALAICDEASPSNGGVKDWKDPHIAHIQLGIDRGYNLYPKLLKALATAAPSPNQAVPEPTYEVEAKEKEE